MKTPTQYGSENEETSFIRRIAAPDRAHGNRKQKKRMAVVGATVGLIAASAVVGYAAMNQGASSETAIPAENMEAQFVSNPDGPTAHPSLAELDTNNNNQLEQGEFFNYLQNKLNADVDKINAAALPEDVKQSLVDRLSDNFESDIKCAQTAFAANKKSKIKVTEKNLKTFFNGLDEFCPTSSVDVTDELLNKYTTAPPTEAPIVKTEAPFVETSAPFVEPVPYVEETKEAPVTTWDEPAREIPPPPVEWNTPSNPEPQPPVVVAEEKKDDVVEQAAEAGNPAAVVEEEHHHDAVEQAAEAGNPEAVVEEEHHEAQVEQAAEEGNEAAIKEEEHHQEQVEEATADAPPAVKEEEQAVDETEQAAESGDQTAVEEVEHKQDELVEEAEQGNPEAVQEEEHLEVVEEEAAAEGNPAAEEIVEHHEEEVQQTEEAPTTAEEDSTPANDPEVVAEEQKADEVEQAAEAGNDAAVEEVEHHEDAVEQAAESGDAAAVAEEEHHEAQVEEAAQEGNEAAIEEEEHHQEQVEEATADAPPAVKEEEQAVDETEQAAESGDQTAVEEVEHKQDELVEEAEHGNPEAVQEEEHLEVVEEEAAAEGNPAAEEIVEHHEEEVQQTEEASSVTESEPNQEPEGQGGDDTADIIQDLGGYDDNESPAEQGDKNWMTKEEFRQKLADHFQKESEYLDEVAAKAEEEYNRLSNHIQHLDDCIEQASNKFGWYGVYEEAPHYDNAVDWVANVCLQDGSN